MLVYCKFIPSWPTETVANTKLYYNNNGNPPANLSYPAGCTPAQTDGSNNLYKLNATTNKTGLEFMMKVMAGDHVDIFGKSYYLNTTNITNTNSTTLDILSLLTNLLLSPGNAAAAKGLTGSQLNTMNNGLIPTSFFRGNNSESATTVPKAYINYIFLDEQFKYAGGGASRVGTSGVVKDHWQTDAQLQNITVPKNGYIFVYVSNESNFDVFFDNLQVIHKPGPLLEETHYYPFGLTMAGISGKAAGGIENKYKYSGKELQHNEFNDGSGLELYDFGKRMQDPQLGRWWVSDPKADLLEMSTSYAYCYNNPISYSDPDGELAILINGRVQTDAERASSKYWGDAVIDAIKNSGIPFSDKMKFVDGDRYRNHEWPYSNGDYDEWGPVINGTFTFGGNSAEGRRKAGERIAEEDFDGIFAKLARDPKTNKIIEKIEIYTHSRGAAFGAGYIDALLELIQKHADQFADPNNEIDVVYNMAPNEADRDGTTEPNGVPSYSHHHKGDKLSGTGMKGNKANFASEETSPGIFGSHSISSFAKDIKAFTKAFKNSNGDSNKLIDDFIKSMRQYGITVTVQ